MVYAGFDSPPRLMKTQTIWKAHRVYNGGVDGVATLYFGDTDGERTSKVEGRWESRYNPGFGQVSRKVFHRYEKICGVWELVGVYRKLRDAKEGDPELIKSLTQIRLATAKTRKERTMTRQTIIQLTAHSLLKAEEQCETAHPGEAMKAEDYDPVEWLSDDDCRTLFRCEPEDITRRQGERFNRQVRDEIARRRLETKVLRKVLQ